MFRLHKRISGFTKDLRAPEGEDLGESVARLLRDPSYNVRQKQEFQNYHYDVFNAENMNQFVLLLNLYYSVEGIEISFVPLYMFPPGGSIFVLPRKRWRIVLAKRWYSEWDRCRCSQSLARYLSSSPTIKASVAFKYRRTSNTLLTLRNCRSILYLHSVCNDAPGDIKSLHPSCTNRCQKF